MVVLVVCWLAVQEDATCVRPLALGRAGCLLLSKMDFSSWCFKGSFKFR